MKIGAIINGEDVFNGEEFKLKSFKGTSIAEIIYTDNDVLRWTLKKKLNGKNLYENFTVSDVIEKFKKAGNLFLTGEINIGNLKMGPEEYARLVTLSTGMPISIINETIEKISNLLMNIEEILKIQIPNEDMGVLERGYYSVNNKTIGWIPTGKNLFAMTPSNHPNVNYIWILAVALGYPVIIRPATDDPFTPYRIIKCLIQAGFPKENFNFFPMSHASIDSFIDCIDKSILFGGDTIEEKYSGSSKVKTFGPGNSAIIINEAYYTEHKDEVLNIVLKSMVTASGRGCINASYIYFIGDGRELAEMVAKKVSEISVMNPLNKEAQLAAIKSEKIAAKYNNFIEDNIALGYSDLTEKYRNTKRMISLDEANYLLPTVLYVKEKQILNNQKIGMELPFPFITFIDDCNEENLLTYISNSLSVSYLGNKKDLFNKILHCEGNGKLYFNAPTNSNDFSDPHEGFISHFLYQAKALKL